jgi:butyryl-CoA dehydrogenase
MDSTAQVRERIRRTAREVAEAVRSDVDTDSSRGEFPSGAIAKMHTAGLTTLLVPKEYGGLDADFVSLTAAQHEFAKVDLGLSNFISDQAVTSQILRLHGTAEQKDSIFPRIVGDGKLWCLGVTEPNAGSDLAAISTQAVRDGDEFVINGHKHWASTGGLATYYVLLVSTEPAKGLRGLSAILVERGAQGLEIGREHPKLGWLTTSTTELRFHDVRVPASSLIGAEGQGYELFEAALTPGRLGIAGQALGLAEAAYEYALDYARRRRQFGRSIFDFQAIRFMLADMATELEKGKLLTYRAAEAADAGDSEAFKLIAMAKYALSDMAMKITTDAVQILGATGYSRDHPVERMMRDAKGLQIADGTNQIMRVIVARELVKE